MAQQVHYGKVVAVAVLAAGFFGVVHGILRDNVWVGLV